MKVRRYIHGQTNIDLLEQGSRAIRSPREIAAGAAAPGLVFGEAFASMGRDLTRLAQHEKRLQDEEDDVTIKMAAMQLKIDEARLKTDPKYDDQLQPNGEMTARVFLDDTEEMIGRYRESIGGIQDEKMRANMLKLAEQQGNLSRVQMRNFINDKREIWNAKGELDLLDLALTGQDFEFARKQTQELLDRDILTRAQAARASKTIDAAEISSKADAVYQQWVQAENVGLGDEAYEKVVANTSLDPMVREEAIKQIKTERTNREYLLDKKVNQAIAVFGREKNALWLGLKTGNKGMADISQFVDRMWITGNPRIQKQAMSWEGELLRATLSGMEVDLDYQQFVRGATISMQRGVPGYVGPATAKKRGYMTQFVQEQLTEDLTPEEALDMEMQLVRTVGMVTDGIHNILLSGAEAKTETTPELLIQAAVTWNEMRGPDGRVTVADDLTEGQRARVMTVANAIARGGDGNAIAQQVIGHHRVNTAEPNEVQKSLNNKYQEEIDASDSFDDLITDSDYYDESVWSLAGVDIENRDMALALYEDTLHSAFIASGGIDPDAVIDATNQQFMQMVPVTWINGRKQAQMGGIEGEDSRDIGQALYDTALKGNTFFSTAEGDEGLVTIEDRADIEFKYPFEANVINPNTGRTELLKHYQVYYKDAPLFNEANGRIHVKVDDDVLIAADKTGYQRARFDKSVEIYNQKQELEKQLQAHERKRRRLESEMKWDTPYTRGARDELQDIANEIELLRAELATPEKAWMLGED